MSFELTPSLCCFLTIRYGQFLGAVFQIVHALRSAAFKKEWSYLKSNLINPVLFQSPARRQSFEIWPQQPDAKHRPRLQASGRGWRQRRGFLRPPQQHQPGADDQPAPQPEFDPQATSTRQGYHLFDDLGSGCSSAVRVHACQRGGRWFKSCFFSSTFLHLVSECPSLSPQKRYISHL